ncbi:uncharacterized protein MAM_02528 [Metarhizium album ARSEF 1941]|uniref:Uncharacterized protein n=1 Tax=Metarhizium album (strain ARSEF 1941) TaxID=1081103 RepID=A0A0B2X2Z4_METAS|nr:uncharacterized protein MAM_02528 [Metarhizium album ARSEF 1941]KHN99675.1 hypothetical protein MAM_02528 [Metarhizium album ARSEF 1941]
MQDLRRDARKRTGDMYIRRGFNAVHHEEFEFFVDKFSWGRFFGRWGQARKLRWPWRTSVNSLRAGGLSLTKKQLHQDGGRSKQHGPRPQSRKRSRGLDLTEPAVAGGTGSGQTSPAVADLAQASYHALEERLASMNARLLQVESYPKDGRPLRYGPGFHLYPTMCEEACTKKVVAST